MINLNAIAEKVLIETVQNGGCSIDIETGASPEKGFFVSYSPYEKTVSIYKGTMLRDTIKAFIIDNEHLLKQSNNFLGLWIHEGKLYIDVSARFDNLRYAYLSAMQQNQLALYDGYKGEEIMVKAPQTSGTHTQRHQYMSMCAAQAEENYNKKV